MKWFKHMTNSSLDERLARFTDKYGLEAYGFFWRVLEAIAENVDETNRKHIEYSIKTWCKLLGIRPQTFRKLIQESSVLGLFQVSFNSDLVTVESPNILKYRDEWTRKKSRTPEQNSEKDKEKETEKEEENPPAPPDVDPELLDFARKFQNEVAITHGNTAPKITDALIVDGALELERAVRIDGLEISEVKLALMWAVHDDFWGQNLKSMARMRTKTKAGVTKIQSAIGEYRRHAGRSNENRDRWAGAI